MWRLKSSLKPLSVKSTMLCDISLLAILYAVCLCASASNVFFIFAYACVCIITNELSRDILPPCVFYFRKGQSDKLKKSILLMQIRHFQRAEHWPRCWTSYWNFLILEICQCVLWRRLGLAEHDWIKRKAIFDINVTSLTRERLGTFCALSKPCWTERWTNQKELFIHVNHLHNKSL